MVRKGVWHGGPPPDFGEGMKLFVSILNQGWLRREVVQTVIPRLFATKGVEIVLDDLERCYAHPICSNRSQITQRFLDTDCDYLLMIDDDIIPIANPAELVATGKDVIGCPALVRKDSRAAVWVAYSFVDGKIAPLDIATIDLRYDLLEVDAVGSGCILVKREVLEKLGPTGWTIEFDEDGKCKTGTDIVFCRRAKEAGFGVYCAVKYICEHIKELGMLAFSSMEFVDFTTIDSSRLGITWGQFAIEARDWEFIKARLFEVNPKDILEIGAGVSTALFSEYFPLDSLETDPQYAQEAAQKATGRSNVARMLLWDGSTPPEALKPSYGLVFIDGPRGKCNGGPGREGAFRLAATKADHILVHDSGRAEEIELQNRILLPEFDRIRANGYQPSRTTYWRRRK